MDHILVNVEFLSAAAQAVAEKFLGRPCGRTVMILKDGCLAEYDHNKPGPWRVGPRLGRFLPSAAQEAYTADWGWAGVKIEVAARWGTTEEAGAFRAKIAAAIAANEN